ncbi:LRR domain containing protein, partial [Trema orientale]
MADLAFILAGTVIEKLGSLANEEISLAWGVKDDIKKLEKTTAILRALLLDAEKKQERDEQLRIWLVQLTDVFHDAQDVLDEFDCEVLPSSIGTVKHLRYLNLNNNKKIKKLPDSICKLQSLQTLVLGGCEELEELPRDIRNLVSLRALVVTTKQKFFAEGGVGRLKSIRLLYILDCKNLRALPDDLRYCTTLRTLLVGNCEQLNLASGSIDEVVELTLRTF